MFNNLNLKIMQKMCIFVKRNSNACYLYHDCFVTCVKSGLTFSEYFDFAHMYVRNVLSGYTEGTDKITFIITDDLFVQI